MHLSVNSHCEAVVFITKISFTFSGACNFPQVMRRGEYACVETRAKVTKRNGAGGCGGGGVGAVRNEVEERGLLVNVEEYLRLLCHSRQKPGGWCWLWAGCPWPGA